MSRIWNRPRTESNTGHHVDSAAGLHTLFIHAGVEVTVLIGKGDQIMFAALSLLALTIILDPPA